MRQASGGTRGGAELAVRRLVRERLHLLGHAVGPDRAGDAAGLESGAATGHHSHCRHAVIINLTRTSPRALTIF